MRGPLGSLFVHCMLIASTGVSVQAQDRAALGPADAAAKVTRLADEYVREFTAAFPESAFLNGLTLARHDGLTDNSLSAVAGWRKQEDRWWGELGGIDPATLWGRPEWITYGFLREALATSRATRVCHAELFPVNQLSGWHVFYGQLALVQPVGSETRRSEALARWRKLPRFLDTEIANLREGVKQGYTTPRHNVELTLGQIQAMLGLPGKTSPFSPPAARASPPPFRSAWAALLAEEINPAIARYVKFLSSEYLPKARS